MRWPEAHAVLQARAGSIIDRCLATRIMLVLCQAIAATSGMVGIRFGRRALQWSVGK